MRGRVDAPVLVAPPLEQANLRAFLGPRDSRRGRQSTTYRHAYRLEKAGELVTVDRDVAG